MDKERMAMHTTEKLTGWFSLYKKTVEDYKIEESDIYNMDEKGFAMGIQGKMRVICSKQHRALMTSDGNREWVSLIECVNILGEVLKMWIIFKGKYHQKCWMEALSEDAHFATSDNGWTNNEIGFSWLEQCFEPETRRKQKGDYRLLIIDGHQSHSTSKVIDFAGKHKIIILCLPSHSPDLLQPLDVGIFGPLAQAYRNQLEAMTRFGLGYAIDKTDFIKMYQKARSTAMIPQVIQSAWAKSGLSPLDPERVLGSLPPRDPRPITPPEMTLTSSSGASLTVPFTPTNSAEVDLLIERIVEHGDEDAQASKKLAKACTSAIADYQMMTITNKSLIQVAERQHEKNTRTRGHYGEAKVMNQEVLEERRQKIASRAASEAANKAKGKSDRENIAHMNQTMKAFMRLDPTIFNDDRKQSPKKKTSSNQSAELNQTSLPPLLEDLHPQAVPPTSSMPARQPRKRAQKAIEAEQPSQAPPQSIRSGRVIRPRNLDI